MTKKDGWENTTNGPDWVDVETLMRAIGALHSGHVALVVSPNGTGFGTGVDVVASIIFEMLPGSSLPANVAAGGEWPNNTSKTLVAHAFKLLHELDYQISKAYKNERLWE